MEPIWGVFFAPIPTLPPWYFITPKNNHLVINWGTPFGGYWQDKSRILDNVRAFCVRCGLRFALRPAFCAAACVLRCGLRFALRPLSLRIACFGRCVRFCVELRCVLSLRVLKEKGEPRGGNDHGAFPLVSLGQMSAAGALTIRAF